jgi:hypothetical protein
LFIPKPFLTSPKPLCQLEEFFGWQAGDSSFDLLDPVHIWSLAPRLDTCQPTPA